MKRSAIVIVVVAILSLPFILFGRSTETRIGLRWGIIEEITDVYFRPFPMIMFNTGRVQSIIPYLKSDNIYGLESIPPDWLCSINYIDKGGYRVETEKYICLLMDSGIINKLSNSEEERRNFIKLCADSLPVNPQNIINYLIGLKNANQSLKGRM